MTIAELNTPMKTSRTSSAFRHILVATDFSEASRRALCDALAIATENQAQLSVIHVLHPDRKYAALDNPPELDLERIAAEKQIKALVDELGPEQKIDATARETRAGGRAGGGSNRGESNRPSGHRHARAWRFAEAGSRLGGGGTAAHRALPGDDDWPEGRHCHDHERTGLSHGFCSRRTLARDRRRLCRSRWLWPGRSRQS